MPKIDVYPTFDIDMEHTGWIVAMDDPFETKSKRLTFTDRYYDVAKRWAEALGDYYELEIILHFAFGKGE